VIISGPRQVSHGELLDRAARVASGFQALGCREGSSIALCLRNDFAFFEASFGAALLGAYPVPVNWHFTVDEACYLITDCNAAVIVVHADLFVRLRNAFPPEAHVLVVETPPEIREAYGIPVTECSIPQGMTAWEEWRDRHAPLPPRPSALPSTMIYTSGTTGRPGDRRESASRRRRPIKSRLVCG
jgi:long-chain acyl-CoA synthetase